MTDDVRDLAREAGLKGASVEEILTELFRDPLEGVPAEVWVEFTRAAAMVGKVFEGEEETGANADSASAQS